MLLRLRLFVRSEQGNSLVTFALMLVAIMAFMGMVLDGGFAFSQYLRMQNAADAAAMAGMRAYVFGGATSDIDESIQAYAEANGADTFQWEWTTEPPDPCGSTDCLQVIASRTFPTFFAGIVHINELTVSAASTVYGTGVAEHGNLWPMTFQWESYDLDVQYTWDFTERHFDVDSFGEDKKGKFKTLYHKHQFDREYGNDIDIMGFSDFKWSDAMQNVDRVSIRFKNVCNAAGSYEIKVSGQDPYAGVWPGAAGELEWIVQNVPIDDLQYIHLTPINLNLLRGTQPKPVQKDEDERDNAYTMQVFDADTGEVAFEFSIYEHVKKGEERDQCTGEEGPAPPPPGWSWIDFDGVPSSDVELANALCHPETSPVLHIDDTVTENAGVNNSQMVRDCLDQWVGQETYVPIYDSAVGQGVNTEFHIAGFAVFVLDDFNLPQKQLVGHFVGAVEGDAAGGGPNYGLQVLKYAR